jgi:phage shock protein PspC (stress-responsive transcriptional regulator)
MPRRLTRNRRHAVLGGVAAGFADYFNVDPVLARLAFVLLTLADGVGLLLYVICWAIIPPQVDNGEVPGEVLPDGNVTDELHDAGASVRAAGQRLAGEMRTAGKAGRGRAAFGIILIVSGSMLLLDRFSWMFRWPYWLRLDSPWPLMLVVIGVALILRPREERT